MQQQVGVEDAFYHRGSSFMPILSGITTVVVYLGHGIIHRDAI